MKGPESIRKERNREAFKAMTPGQKLSYIYEYYKLPLFTACVVLAVCAWTVIHAVTKKNPVLYLAYTNFAAGEELNEELTSGFLDYKGYDKKKNEVTVYSGLVLEEDASAEDHRYVYASKMKIMGAISAKRMDLVLMNESACKEISASGLLLDLEEIRDRNPGLYEKLQPYMAKNTVILEDNSIEYKLNEADTYEAVTAEVNNSLIVTSCPIFRSAAIDGTLKIGIIANSTRIDEILDYFAYLFNVK